MIRVAVIGAGHWGPNLLRNFHDAQQSEVVAVVDRDDARLEHVRKRFPDVKTTKDAAEVVDDASVDAVVVATPTITHYDVVKPCLERGKHVLVEKPITVTAETADELCAIADAKGTVLMVGHVFVYNSAVQRVKQYLDDGDLGRVFYVSMVRTNLGPIRMDVNAAWDLASHDISIVNYWLGSEPLRVAAVGHDWINRGVEDAVFATLSYPNDVLVNLHASWLNPRKARDITVVGEKRMLTFDDMNGLEPVRIYDKQVLDQTTRPSYIDSIGTFRASVRSGDITIPPVTLGEPLKNECMEFLRCIADKARPVSDGRFGAGVVRALEAMDRSLANEGREEEVRR